MISAPAHVLDIGGARVRTQACAGLPLLLAKSSKVSGLGDNARLRKTQSCKGAPAMEASGVSANILAVRVGDARGRQPRFVQNAETDIAKTTCNR